MADIKLDIESRVVKLATTHSPRAQSSLSYYPCACMRTRTSSLTRQPGLLKCILLVGYLAAAATAAAGHLSQRDARLRAQRAAGRVGRRGQGAFMIAGRGGLGNWKASLAN